MKKYLVAILMLFAGSLLHAQDKKNILALMSKQQTAWNNGDIDTFMQGYWKSDSLVFVGKSAPYMAGKIRSIVIKKLIPVKPPWASSRSA